MTDQKRVRKFLRAYGLVEEFIDSEGFISNDYRYICKNLIATTRFYSDGRPGSFNIHDRKFVQHLGDRVWVYGRTFHLLRAPDLVLTASSLDQSLYAHVGRLLGHTTVCGAYALIFELNPVLMDRVLGAA